MKSSILLVQTEPSTSDGLIERENLVTSFHVQKISTPEEAIQICQQTDEKVASVVLGSSLKNPIQVSQRLYAANPSLSVIILTGPEKIEHLRKSLNFTPFLGQFTSCAIEEKISELADLIKSTSEVAIQNRKSRDLSIRMNQQLQGFTHRRQEKHHYTSQYLERLLDTAPIGIVTVDNEGHVLALNRAAGPMLGKNEADALGKNIKVFLPDIPISEGKKVEITGGENEDQFFEVTVSFIHGADQRPGYLLLIMDVTQRKLYEKELRNAIGMRDEFLSIASHELNTPLTSMKLQSQIRLRKAESGDISHFSHEKILGMLNQDLKQINRLSRLVEDMLDVSRIATGRLEVRKEEIDLCALTKDVINRAELEAQLSGSTIAFACTPSSVVGNWDGFRLEQVIMNLINNALKYAPASPIKVEVLQEDRNALVIVEDKGPGIPKEFQDRVFKQFERATPLSSATGFGLGLYISKEIIQAHKGRISLYSSPGQGCKFVIELPLNF